MRTVLVLVAMAILPAGCLSDGATGALGGGASESLANEEQSLTEGQCRTIAWTLNAPATLTYDVTAREGSVSIYVMEKGEERHMCDGERFSYFPDASSERALSAENSVALATGDYAMGIVCADLGACRYSLRATLHT